MAIFRSTRFFSRARTTDQRGFALVTAIVLALLYFALMELLLLDSARQLQAAQRFRARIVATNLAESAAEGAAEQIFSTVSKRYPISDWQGTAIAELSRNAETGKFTIKSTGTTIGSVIVSSTVDIQGVAYNGNVKIDFTQHTQ